VKEIWLSSWERRNARNNVKTIFAIIKSVGYFQTRPLYVISTRNKWCYMYKWYILVVTAWQGEHWLHHPKKCLPEFYYLYLTLTPADNYTKIANFDCPPPQKKTYHTSPSSLRPDVLSCGYPRRVIFVSDCFPGTYVQRIHQCGEGQYHEFIIFMPYKIGLAQTFISNK